MASEMSMQPVRSSRGIGFRRVAAVSAVYCGLGLALPPDKASALSFTSYTTASGPGGNDVYGVYASGSNLYAATTGGLSIDQLSGEPVPGPLPLLGAGAAFGWSRRLRRRLPFSQRRHHTGSLT